MENDYDDDDLSLALLELDEEEPEPVPLLRFGPGGRFTIDIYPEDLA